MDEKERCELLCVTFPTVVLPYLLGIKGVRKSVLTHLVRATVQGLSSLPALGLITPVKAEGSREGETRRLQYSSINWVSLITNQG